MKKDRDILLRLGHKATTLFFLLLASATTLAAQPAVRLVTQDYPPYISNRNGQAEGPLVNIVKEAFRRTNTPVVIEALPWSRALSMVTEGTADGLFTIKKTRERETSLLYPNQPLLTQDYVFFVREDSRIRFNGSLDSVASLRIGVVANTSYGGRFDDAVQKALFKHIQTAYDYEHIFRMLQEGRIDTVICSRLVGLSFARRVSAQGHIVVSGPPVETTSSYLVFTRKSDNNSLANNFDQAIESMRRDGSLTRMLEPISR